jgi:hypothetical protein
LLRFCSVRSNADPCVSSDTQHFDWALLEADCSTADKDYAFHQKQLSFDLFSCDKDEIWTDVAATPPKRKSGGSGVFIAVMGVTGCGKSSYIKACTSMEAVVEILSSQNLRT